MTDSKETEEHATHDECAQREERVLSGTQKEEGSCDPFPFLRQWNLFGGSAGAYREGAGERERERRMNERAPEQRAVLL